MPAGFDYRCSPDNSTKGTPQVCQLAWPRSPIKICYIPYGKSCSRYSPFNARDCDWGLTGVGPSQVTEIVESILSLGPDFGPISSFSRPKRGLLSGIHGESEMAL